MIVFHDRRGVSILGHLMPIELNVQRVMCYSATDYILWEKNYDQKEETHEGTIQAENAQADEEARRVHSPARRQVVISTNLCCSEEEDIEQVQDSSLDCALHFKESNPQN